MAPQNKDHLAISEEMEKAYQAVREKGFHCVYLSLIGSQNYGLDLYEPDYQSDFDFKCIVLPNFLDVIHGTAPVTTTLKYENGLIEVKDIRSFMETLFKMNPVYLEIFITENYLVDIDHVDEVMKIRSLIPRLIQERRFPLLHSIYGAIKDEVRHMNISDSAYSGKKLCYAFRHSYLFDQAMKGVLPLRLPEDVKEECLKAKLCQYSPEEARFKAEEICNRVESILYDSLFRDEYKKYSMNDAKYEMDRLAKFMLERHLLNEAKKILRERKEIES